MTATKNQMEEVWSWVHNERRCVTTKTISLSMGMPRSEASSLLAKLPSYKTGDYSYECTKCCTNQENGKTVIRLCKSIVSGNDMDTDEVNGTVYSLSLADTESVHTAHEKDMAQFRDMLAEEDSPQATATTMALDPTLHQHSIYNEQFQTARLKAHASQEDRLSGRVVAAPPPAASAMPSSRMPTKSVRKATTAASFFAAKVPAKSKDSSKQSSKPKDTAKKSPKEKKSKTTNDNKKPKATKEGEDEPEEMDIDASDGFVQEEKENSCNKKVGNADDFVGDEDEDDDFIQEEEDRKRRNAAREKKQRAKKKTQKEVPEQEEEDDDEPVKVHGAMDAFTQHQEKKSSTHKNKRRKRLVEKTTMDASGYIHTETQAVWEDVEDDEEPEQVKMAPIKKAPVKNTKNMKQGNLMGFFKKK